MNKHKTLPLETDELSFLTTKYRRLSKSFWRVITFMTIVGVSLPLLVLMALNLMPPTEEKDQQYREEHFPNIIFVLTAVFLLALIILGGYYSYKRTIGKIRKDISEKNKIVERTVITQKIFMPHNNSFHFYIESEKKNSIEVSMNDYQAFEKGDEINIEYSKYSEEYFGYF